MQWATSLVTVTPTSGPCFIDEAKLNNYPPLNTQTDTHTCTHTLLFHGSTVKATGDRVSHLRSHSSEKGQVLCERLRASIDSKASCCSLRKWTDNRAESAMPFSTIQRLLICPQTKQPIQNQTSAQHQIFWAGCEWQDTITGCQVCHGNELRAIYGLHDSDI